jgi:hypothetical protein
MNFWLGTCDGFPYRWSKFRHSQVVDEFILRSKTLVVILAGVIKTSHAASFGNSWANRRRVSLSRVVVLDC